LAGIDCGSRIALVVHASAGLLFAVLCNARLFV
jgi:hypothetical protein